MIRPRLNHRPTADATVLGYNDVDKKISSGMFNMKRVSSIFHRTHSGFVAQL